MRKNISSGTTWEEKVGYSRAVRIGNFIAVSGTTAIIDGKIAGEGSASEQTLIIFQKIEAALKEAGASLVDIIRNRIYITNIKDWEEVGRVHKKLFGSIKPACTIVEVNALIQPGLLIEIECEAIVNTGK